MNKRKAFTLIELLVVISIIALLMSILMPSLSKAREQAQRLVCTSHMRDLMVGMEVYAAKWEGVYAPCMDGTIVKTLEDGSTKIFAGQVGAPGSWPANEDYRKIIGYAGAVDKDLKDDEDATFEETGEMLGTVMPSQFKCPSDILAKNDVVSAYGTLISYGYNMTEWYGSGPGSLTFVWGKGTPSPTVFVGHQAARIRRPSESAIFLDSNDWWIHWSSANFAVSGGWDDIGQAPSEDYPFDGPTLYRHSEGSNVAFYDGHVAFVKKREVWREASDYNRNPRRPGMWVADSAKIIDAHPYLPH